MNKKILVIPVLLLTFALLSIPVLGAPATKIEGVTATLFFIPIPGPSRLVDHGIMHVRDGTSVGGTVSLNIPGLGTLEGTLYGEWMGRTKFSQPAPDPEAEGLIMSKHVWTFTDALGYTGTFEGVVHAKWIGLPPEVRSYSYYKMVLQGTGDFEGQTLKLSYEGAPPEVLEGCLVIPK